MIQQCVFKKINLKKNLRPYQGQTAR